MCKNRRALEDVVGWLEGCQIGEMGHFAPCKTCVNSAYRIAKAALAIPDAKDAPTLGVRFDDLVECTACKHAMLAGKARIYRTCYYCTPCFEKIDTR